MLHQFVFQIQNRSGPSYEQDAIPVVQHPHLVRGQQLSAAHLEVGGVGAGASLRLPMGLGVDGGLAQGLRNVLVGACLVAAEIEQRVRVAGDGFPGILVEFLDLRHVLDDRAARNVAGTHGRQFPWEPRQVDGRRFVEDEVDMTRQCAMVQLVCTVVKRLEYLGVQQAYQKVEGRIIIRDHGIEGALFLAQCVQVHIVMVRDRLDLWQVEGSQPHSGADQDAFCRLARDKLSRTFSSNSQKIHKKRCQKHRMAPDTSFDRLHFSVQQVFAEIRIVWQLVDIWLPAPLDFG